jgi:hypothetical protein
MGRGVIPEAAQRPGFVIPETAQRPGFVIPETAQQLSGIPDIR